MALKATGKREMRAERERREGLSGERKMRSVLRGEKAGEKRKETRQGDG